MICNISVLETQDSGLGLAGLLVVPCLGLVWPGPVLPALPWPGPATTTAAACFDFVRNLTFFNLYGWFGLAGLPVVPSLGLVWPGPVLPALPALPGLPALPWIVPATTTTVGGKGGREETMEKRDS